MGEKASDDVIEKEAGNQIQWSSNFVFAFSICSLSSTS